MGVIIEIIGVIVLLYFLLHALSFVIKYRIFFYGFIGWILYYHSHFFFLFLISIIIIIVEYLLRTLKKDIIGLLGVNVLIKLKGSNVRVFLLLKIII